MNDQLTEAFEAVLQAADAVRNRAPQEDVDNLVDVASKKFIAYNLDQIEMFKRNKVGANSFIFSSNQMTGFSLRYEAISEISRHLIDVRSRFDFDGIGKDRKSIPVKLIGFVNQRRDGEAIYRKLNELSEAGVAEAKKEAKEKGVRFSRKSYDEAFSTPLTLLLAEYIWHSGMEIKRRRNRRRSTTEPGLSSIFFMRSRGRSQYWIFPPQVAM